MITIDEIRLALTAVQPDFKAFEPRPSQAAVAMILADGTQGIEVCFIRRAERAGDPWSGQVAFPGGRASGADADAFAVAERETWEEIGMRLAQHHRLGPLPMRPIERNVRRDSLTLWPFVYYVGAEEQAMATVRLPHEVASVFWVPVGHLFDSNAVTEFEYPQGVSGTTFPGILFGEHVIWGLTLRVLASFAEVMQRTLPALP
ncbi:MAG: CoA pyrophosphatase [Gammaproteobacteria bacterium]|nr:CoA pyrophosphatase [Gammaproteobacteria bacterium]